MFPAKFYGRVGIGVEPLTPFYVKTRFEHIGFVPIIPLESCICFRDADGNELCDSRDYVPPMQFRSVFMGYMEPLLQGVGGLGFICCLVACCAWFFGGSYIPELMLGGGSACFLSIMIYVVFRILFRYRSKKSKVILNAALFALAIARESQSSEMLSLINDFLAENY